MAHLYLLRVDQDEANLVWRGAHEHRGNDAVDCAGLTRASGTRNEHVWRGGNVEKHGAACDVFANGNVERMHCRTRLLGNHEIAKRNQFAHSVWHLNTNCRLARNWRKNSDIGCGHGVRNVARERRDLGDFYAAAKRQLVTRNRWAACVANHFGFYVVLLQRINKLVAALFSCALIGFFVASNGEHVERWQHPVACTSAGAKRHLLRLGFHDCGCR